MATSGKRSATLYVVLSVKQPDRSAAVGVPVRVVIGSETGWQMSSAGTRCATDEEGVCRLELPLSLANRRRKMPGNFFTTLLASRERTQHVQVAIEVEYADRPWLSVIDVDRFADGTTARLEAMRVFGRATDGRFTDDVPFNDGTWRKRLSSGQVMTLPGFDVNSVALDPDPDALDDVVWRLQLTLTRWPDPVLRDASTIQYGSGHVKKPRT